MDVHQPSSPSNPWFAVSIGLLGVIVGYGIATMQTSGGPGIGGTQVVQSPPAVPEVAPDVPPAPPPGPLPAIDPSSDHVRGNPAAKVSVVEYSDFECPFCKRHVPTMQEIMKAYGQDVNWVFRHFPLSFHENAQKQAEASECAAELGGNDAFWTYHDKIFERTTSNGTGFPLDKLVPLAKEIGLDERKFKDCLDGGTYAQKVTDQMQGGIAAGVKGTPGNFVVNNETKEQREVSGAVPFSTFKSIIDDLL